MRIDLESRNRICSICGDHIGRGYDHKECSAAKKEMYEDICAGRASKKLTKAQCETMGKFFEGK